ncbi:MAG: phosphoglucosamine mutase [Phycisphaeraceae bacterium]
MTASTSPAAAPLMLSVSGARGIVGQSLTPPMIARYAAAVGSWLREQSDADQPTHVVLGRDSRPSGPLCECAAVAGLLSVGCRVTCLGIASTPGVAVMVRHLHAQGGIVITASHNPIIWNGVKAIRGDGVAPTADQARQIIDRFESDRLDYVDVHGLQPVAFTDAVVDVHRDAILPYIDVDAIRQAGLRVVVDSVHGAGGRETAALLDALGVECIHYYAEPTGQFPHPPEPTAEHLTELCQQVAHHGAAAGFAQDPDADRLAIVDETGRYIGEEYTLAMCARHLLKQGDVAVANLSTSRMIDDVAAAVGARVERTAVGEANVAEGMREHEAVIGGEGNGGVILPGVCHIRDSLVGIALVLEMLAKRKLPLSKLVAETPAYAILKDKVPVDADLVKKLGPTLRDEFADVKVDEQDGVRLDWPDRWVHVRASNTEPILRLIAEARDADTAAALLADVRQALGLG